MKTLPLPAAPWSKARPGPVAWAPIAILPAAAWVLTRDALPPWGFMWTLCLALYAGCKWLTLHDAIRRNGAAPLGRILGYLFAWPGMDGAVFLHDHARATRPDASEWAFAIGKLALGLLLTWVAVPAFIPAHPLFVGWAGMVGLIFVLHFGCFHLLSLAWRCAGVRADPIMKNPMLATSLAEFWGRRWNAAFHELVNRYVFRWALRRIGAGGATLLVFLISGAVHELVISVPARGGYGGPTVYFLLHGLALLAERSTPGRRLGLGTGWRGRAFALVVAAAPVGLLFHGPFVRHVILPFLHAIGAT